jgi:hypothetical protein
MFANKRVPASDLCLDPVLELLNTSVELGCLGCLHLFSRPTFLSQHLKRSGTSSAADHIPQEFTNSGLIRISVAPTDQRDRHVAYKRIDKFVELHAGSATLEVEDSIECSDFVRPSYAVSLCLEIKQVLKFAGWFEAAEVSDTLDPRLTILDIGELCRPASELCSALLFSKPLDGLEIE